MDDQALVSIRQAIEVNIAPLFDHVTVEAWSPSEDARRRIMSAKDKLPASSGLTKGDIGWQVIGKDDSNQWIFRDADLEAEVEIFSGFMTRVVGQFTRSFLSEIPERIENRWLMSLLVHLMLNSVSIDQGTENEVRAFPYI